VLADIYADPSYSIASQQDESLTWLGDERHVPALRGADVER
jgi:hypothetical protein